MADEEKLTPGQQKLLARLGAENERLKTGEPDIDDPISRLLFYRHVAGEGGMSKEAYMEALKDFRETPKKKPLFDGMLTVTAKYAEHFLPKGIVDRRLPRLRPARRSRGVLDNPDENPHIPRNPASRERWDSILAAGSAGSAELERMLADYLAHFDGNPGTRLPEEWEKECHCLLVWKALADAPEFAASLNAALLEDHYREIELLYELYTDRLADARRALASNPERMTNLVAGHSLRAREAGYAGVIPDDYAGLEALYRRLAHPGEERVRLETQYKTDTAARKAELSSAIHGKRQEEADRLGAELKKRRELHTAAIRELSGAGAQGRAKLFSGFLEELVWANKYSLGVEKEARELAGKIRVGKSGVEVALNLDSRPSVRDAFAGYTSGDCTKGNADMFSHPQAHNIKIIEAETGIHRGNIYVLEATVSGYPVLHIDAIQLPTKVAHREFVADVVEALWQAAGKKGCNGLTANVQAALVSNHHSIQEAFEHHFKKSRPVEVEFPKGLDGQFHSLGEEHRIIGAVNEKIFVKRK